MLCPLNAQRRSALQGGCAQQNQIIHTAPWNNASLKRSFVPSSRKSTSITARRSSSRVVVQANATQKDVLEVVNPNVGTVGSSPFPYIHHTHTHTHLLNLVLTHNSPSTPTTARLVRSRRQCRLLLQRRPKRSSGRTTPRTSPFLWRTRP